jgi:hypothetical protein
MHDTVTVMTIIWRWPMESFEIGIQITRYWLIAAIMTKKRPCWPARHPEKMANFCRAVTVPCRAVRHDPSRFELALRKN